VPTKRPTKQPTKVPTKRPTKRPTKQPTKAPIIACGTSGVAIEAYINSVTLSNKTLSLSGNSSLNKALQQLVASNNHTLSTCLAAHQCRLNQRFAYLAFAFSTGKGSTDWFGSSNECAWKGITCDINNTVTKLDLYKKGLVGTIPDDVGLWTSLNFFGAGRNSLTGSLPSSIGLWTGVTFFEVHLNQLVGTVPKEVANWRSIKAAYFESNMFNGTMPAFGNNLCPKKGTPGFLWADCSEIQCGCCSYAGC
jgi:PT repeat